jgi:preprotein translocase subunit SecG
MSTFIVLIHVVVCISLIFVVLLQTGKGADMGAAFGGGSSQTIFGSTGASSFLSKMTTGAAIVFMLTSLSLAYFSSRRPTSSIIQSESTQPETVRPATEPAATEGASAPAQPVSDSPEKG